MRIARLTEYLCEFAAPETKLTEKITRVTCKTEYSPPVSLVRHLCDNIGTLAVTYKVSCLSYNCQSKNREEQKGNRWSYKVTGRIKGGMKAVRLIKFMQFKSVC